MLPIKLWSEYTRIFAMKDQYCSRHGNFIDLVQTVGGEDFAPI